MICFPVSKRIENKPDYHYVGIGSKQLGKKKGGEGPGEEWVAWITIMRVQKEGKITHTLLPFMLAAPHPLFCGMLCHMSVFYRFYFDPRLMPNGQNQITMRKVCTGIQSLASRLTNNHSSYR